MDGSTNYQLFKKQEENLLLVDVIDQAVKGEAVAFNY